MAGLLNFLEERWMGILVGFLCLMGVLVVVQWFAWIFGLGRYRERPGKDAKTQPSSIGYIVADLLVKIINDFRHLLALIIMVIFSIALAYAMFHAGNAQEEMGKALQSVMATLGGLVGSLIGYYFGESAARKTSAPDTPTVVSGAAQQVMPAGQGDGIKPAPSVSDLKAASKATTTSSTPSN